MPKMPDMQGDATMLRQVIHNLMQNALDALKQVEKPEILVQTEFDESSIKLTVKDNGQGFPVEMLAHAFEPYVTTKAHGTGLGLAIVKKMIEEHFGQIKIENNLAGGACITIVLPIEKLIETELINENNVKAGPKKKVARKKVSRSNKQNLVREA